MSIFASLLIGFGLTLLVVISAIVFFVILGFAAGWLGTTIEASVKKAYKRRADRAS
jgi:hypothetical protein